MAETSNTRQQSDINAACLLPYICLAVGLQPGARLVEVLARIRLIQAEVAQLERRRRMMH